MQNQLAEELYQRIKPGLPTADMRQAVADALATFPKSDSPEQLFALNRLIFVCEDVSTEGLDVTIP